MCSRGGGHAPGRALDGWVQVVVPALAALLAQPAIQAGGNEGPLLGAVLPHQLAHQVVLLCCPGALDQAWLEHLLPAVQALHVRAPRQLLGDDLPVLGAIGLRGGGEGQPAHPKDTPGPGRPGQGPRRPAAGAGRPLTSTASRRMSSSAALHLWPLGPSSAIGAGGAGWLRRALGYEISPAPQQTLARWGRAGSGAQEMEASGQAEALAADGVCLVLEVIQGVKVFVGANRPLERLRQIIRCGGHGESHFQSPWQKILLPPDTLSVPYNAGQCV